MLIPTLYKTKLPRELSYPIGAEIVSERLEGVPQYSEFRICFLDVLHYWKSKFQKVLDEGSDYEIIEARLGSPPEIFIYPVKRELKHKVKEALLADGLPNLRQWMMRNSKASSLQYKSAAIIFSPPTLTVRFEESSRVA